MLYLPRGWWHAVAASEGVHSLHLTCGMQTTTGADLLQWLSEDLRRETTVRSDLPRFGTEAEKADFVRSLGDLVVKEFEDGTLLDRFLAMRDATDRASSVHEEGQQGRGLRGEGPFLSPLPSVPRCPLRRCATVRERSSGVRRERGSGGTPSTYGSEGTRRAPRPRPRRPPVALSAPGVSQVLLSASTAAHWADARGAAAREPLSPDRLRKVIDVLGT
ncbi:cupin domain-containing protein [Streptomyces albogriseolus]|nr:cupin domain-containing protein [Streptomyces albogriseolus]